MVVKSKPKPPIESTKAPSESSKVFVRDFESSEVPKIIESRLSNDKIKQDLQKNRIRLESMKRDE